MPGKARDIATPAESMATPPQDPTITSEASNPQRGVNLQVIHR